MNRNVFEGRYLIGLVGTIIKQDSVRRTSSRMDWERLYHMADYHRIASIVYLAILGSQTHVPDTWRDRFFSKYQSSLRYAGDYERCEQEILNLLNMRGVPAVVLESSSNRRLYQIKEAAGNSPLRLFMDEDSFMLTRGYLIDIGYTIDQSYMEFGDHFINKDGFTVDLYRRLPFTTKNYQKQMTNLMERANVDKTYPYMHTFTVDNSMVFRLAELCYNYCDDRMTLRQLIDVLLFYKRYRNHMNMTYILSRLQEFRMETIAAALFHLAAAWFGSRRDELPIAVSFTDTQYEQMESCILNRSFLGVDTMQQAADLREEIEKERNKEKRAVEAARRKVEGRPWYDEILKTLRWILPEYHYMCALYPILEKFPVLLPVYWAVRCLRLTMTVLHIGKYASMEKLEKELEEDVLEEEEKAAEVPVRARSEGNYRPGGARRSGSAVRRGRGKPVLMDAAGNVIPQEQEIRAVLESGGSIPEDEPEETTETAEMAETMESADSFEDWTFPEVKTILKEDPAAGEQHPVPVQQAMPFEKNTEMTIEPHAFEGDNDENGYGARIVRATFQRLNRDGSDYVPQKPEEKPEIMEATNENNEKVDVVRWHFPTIEEVDARDAALRDE